MAYVTSRSNAAPRVLRVHLHDYLEMLVHQPNEYLTPERGFEPWPEEIFSIVIESRGERTVADVATSPLRSGFRGLTLLR